MLNDLKQGWLLKVSLNMKGWFNNTFSPVFSKDSFRIIMALVAHFNLEMHQMDVKTAFRNDQLFKEVYKSEARGFQSEGQSMWHVNWTSIFTALSKPLDSGLNLKRS